ncbi:hypothetical protein WMF11_22475 [Sorangium sp. So ce295]|uniref:hypothetical protein n=1 Tax=Sorangium sp. So ce295 TaxID=3133295 RepID=UPI003F60D523
MNKEAVALAADSAVTVRSTGGHKIFTSANKVFALSKYEPVGIMVFGLAEFMGTPWETIIKVFRDDLGHRRFDTVRDYATEFFRFLSTDAQLSADRMQRDYVRDDLSHFFHEVREFYRERIKEIFSLEGELEESRVLTVFGEALDSVKVGIDSDEMIDGYTKADVARLRRLYLAEVVEATQHCFRLLKLTPALKRRMSSLAAHHLVRWSEELAPHASGVVIAGFGGSERFPSLSTAMVDGVAGSILRRSKTKSISAGVDCPAVLSPFAQREMVYSFMEGVDRDYQAAIERDILRLLKEYPITVLDQVPGLAADVRANIESKLGTIATQTYRGALEKFRKFRQERFWEPIIQVVKMLPKDELASMAETLVALTSFRRKISMEAETVGGPIDVAVISKGDGLIWIKRKHYFQPQLNHHFFSNYYKGSSYEKEANGEQA